MESHRFDGISHVRFQKVWFVEKHMTQICPVVKVLHVNATVNASDTVTEFWLKETNITFFRKTLHIIPGCLKYKICTGWCSKKYASLQHSYEEEMRTFRCTTLYIHKSIILTLYWQHYT